MKYEGTDLEVLKQVAEDAGIGWNESATCMPCCDFCIHADKVEHDDMKCVVGEEVMCHKLNKKVWIGGGCDEHCECRVCGK